MRCGTTKYYKVLKIVEIDTHPHGACHKTTVRWDSRSSAGRDRARDLPSMRKATSIPHILIAIATTTLFLFQIPMLTNQMSA
jgi:hypothetical protein